MSRSFGALILAICIGLGGAGCTGCATALLEGKLVADGAGGMAVQTAEGAVVAVRWPGDLHVRTDGDQLALANQLGFVVGREGESVRTGGGEDPNGPGFAACGPVFAPSSGPPGQ